MQPHPIFPMQVQAVKLNIGVTVTANLAIFLFLVQVAIYSNLDFDKKKMAIILPTGQWYAPSAVINDAWYCMVLHCIA